MQPPPIVASAALLDEAAETKLLAAHEQSLAAAHIPANNRPALLVAVGGFDPTRPPVVLVHGYNGAPADLTTRLTASGKQVLLLAYDDRSKYTHDSGRELALAIAGVRAKYYPAGTPLDIVAHSMGGIVAHCALNYLQNPKWLPGEDGAPSTPRGGFAHMRLRTIDTPLDGFGSEHRIPVLSAIADFFAWLAFVLIGRQALYDMSADSKMFEYLYEPRLEGVSVKNFAAKQPDKPDNIRSIPDLDAEELLALARFCASGGRERPYHLRTRNLAGSLMRDDRFFDKLCPRVIEEVAPRGTLSLTDAKKAHRFSELYDEVMPRETGTHESVKNDDLTRNDDLVDQIVREFS